MKRKIMDETETKSHGDKPKTSTSGRRLLIWAAVTLLIFILILFGLSLSIKEGNVKDVVGFALTIVFFWGVIIALFLAKYVNLKWSTVGLSGFVAGVVSKWVGIVSSPRGYILITVVAMWLAIGMGQITLDLRKEMKGKDDKPKDEQNSK
jgi:hypothetical protein